MESQSLQESPKKSPSIVIPEDFESQKEMVRRVMNVCPKKYLQIPHTAYMLQGSGSFALTCITQLEGKV